MGGRFQITFWGTREVAKALSKQLQRAGSYPNYKCQLVDGKLQVKMWIGMPFSSKPGREGLAQILLDYFENYRALVIVGERTCLVKTPDRAPQEMTLDEYYLTQKD